jgi:tripartite motif-containing protein 71
MMTTATSISYSHTVGSLSNQGRGFQNPMDVALDSRGVMYVINRAGPELTLRLPCKRVTMCTVDQDYLGEFGTGGTAPGEFWWPSSLAFDSRDRLYVADEALNRITVFSNQGELLNSWGEVGTGPGQLNRPSGIVFDAQDQIWLSDSGNHRVQKFTAEGEFLAALGERGSGPGQFEAPWGLALDFQGQMYVSDWGNNRIQKFDPSGNFLEEFPKAGAVQPKSQQISRPAGLAVDPDCNIYVADWGNERVRVLAPDGELLATLRGDSVTPQWADAYFLANPEEGALRQEADLEPVVEPPELLDREQSANVEKLFWGPTSVKLDGKGNILVVDSCRHRIQVYRNNG